MVFNYENIPFSNVFLMFVIQIQIQLLVDHIIRPSWSLVTSRIIIKSFKIKSKLCTGHFNFLDGSIVPAVVFEILK